MGWHTQKQGDEATKKEENTTNINLIHSDLFYWCLCACKSLSLLSLCVASQKNNKELNVTFLASKNTFKQI